MTHLKNHLPKLFFWRIVTQKWPTYRIISPNYSSEELSLKSDPPEESSPQIILLKNCHSKVTHLKNHLPKLFFWRIVTQKWPTWKIISPNYSSEELLLKSDPPEESSPQNILLKNCHSKVTHLKNHLPKLFFWRIVTQKWPTWRIISPKYSSEELSLKRDPPEESYPQNILLKNCHWKWPTWRIISPNYSSEELSLKRDPPEESSPQIVLLKNCHSKVTHLKNHLPKLFFWRIVTQKWPTWRIISPNCSSEELSLKSDPPEESYPQIVLLKNYHSKETHLKNHLPKLFFWRIVTQKRPTWRIISPNCSSEELSLKRDPPEESSPQIILLKNCHSKVTHLKNHLPKIFFWRIVTQKWPTWRIISPKYSSEELSLKRDPPEESYPQNILLKNCHWKWPTWRIISPNYSSEELSLKRDPPEESSPQIVLLKNCHSKVTHLKNHLPKLFFWRIVTQKWPTWRIISPNCSSEELSLKSDPPEESYPQIVLLKNYHSKETHLKNHLPKLFFWRIVTQKRPTWRIISPNCSSEELSLKRDPPEESSPQIILLKNCHSKVTHLKNHLPKIFFWRIVTQKWPTWRIISPKYSSEELSLKSDPPEKSSPQIILLKNCHSKVTHLKNHLPKLFFWRIVTQKWPTWRIISPNCSSEELSLKSDPPEESSPQIILLKNCYSKVTHLKNHLPKLFFWRIVTQKWPTWRIISPNSSSEELSLKRDPPEESSPQIILLKNCHSKETHLKNHLPKLFFWRIVTQKRPTWRIISPNYSSEELSLKSDPPEESSSQNILLKNCRSKVTHLKNHFPKLFFWRIVTQKWPTWRIISPNCSSEELLLKSDPLEESLSKIVSWTIFALS